MQKLGSKEFTFYSYNMKISFNQVLKQGESEVFQSVRVYLFYYMDHTQQ